MDAIRKKMKSLKDETEGLLAIIQKFEEQTAESNKVLSQIGTRPDSGKKGVRRNISEGNTSTREQ